MKKKLFLALAISIMLVCFFAITAFAATPDASGEKFTLENGTELPIWDTEGNGLIWYASTENTDDGYADYDYVQNNQTDKSVTPYITHSYWNDATKNQTSEIKITTTAGTTISTRSSSSTIVVVNMQGALHSNGKVFNCYNQTFKENQSLEAVYFDKTTTTFAGWTCYKCSNLRYINLGNTQTVTLAGEANFAECPKLADIEDLPSTLQRMERWQFQNTGITEITIPESLTYLGDTNFNNCQKLVNVYGFEALVLRLIKAAQENAAEGETATYELPNSTFCDCKLLNMPFTNGVIPEGVTAIGNYAFDDCNGEGWETVVLPNSLVSIGQNGFQGCKGIKKVVLGASFTTFVNYDGFKNCSNLAEVYIPSTLTVIPGNVFNSAANNCVFYFTGTKDQLDTLKANTNGNNTAFNNAYNQSLSVAEFEALETKSGRYIVYGYNPCKAFYNNVHNIVSEEGNTCSGTCDRVGCGLFTILENPVHAEELKLVFGENKSEVVDYYAVMSVLTVCENCGTQTNVQEYGSIFENIGLTASLNGTVSIAFGVAINKDALEVYEEMTETTLAYGLVVSATATTAPITGVTSEGKLELAANTLSVDMTGAGYTTFTAKLSNVGEASTLNCAGYVVDGTNVAYLNHKTSDTEAEILSYEVILEKTKTEADE